MSEFKDMLKYFRGRAGLSQSELAAKLGLRRLFVEFTGSVGISVPNCAK